jgi:hypothetical protein
MEHCMGYSGKHLKTVEFHPHDPNTFIYNIGG